ncbi:hypothetical protein [Cyclobacterium plantarum]|uniref:hypothetical protein n=1 Tax=Cyclobacterium plantarum TaxID=2716263 RepID=UPI003F71A4A9
MFLEGSNHDLPDGIFERNTFNLLGKVISCNKSFVQEGKKLGLPEVMTREEGLSDAKFDNYSAGI